MQCNENCGCIVFHEETLSRIKSTIHSDNTIESIASIFKILGDFTRVKILEALKEDELCVCDLAYLLGVSKSAISHQMKFLKSHDLVTQRREGKMVYYKTKCKEILEIIHSAYEYKKERA